MELHIRELVSLFLMRMNSLSAGFRWQGELQRGYAVEQKISQPIGSVSALELSCCSALILNWYCARDGVILH